MRVLVLTLVPLLLFAETEIQLLERIETLEKRMDESIMDSIAVGGRVQIDFDYRSSQGAFKPASIPLDDDAEDARLGMEVRDSRVWMKSKNMTEVGLIRSVVEVYFKGEKGNEINTNAHDVALRYLYATLGGLSVGQASSLFSTIYASDTLQLPINLTIARQPLLSYRYQFTTNMEIAAACEQSESYVNDTHGMKKSLGNDQWPDITLRLRSFHKHFEYAVALMARQVRYDGSEIGGVMYGEGDAHWGWAVNTSAKINLYALDNLYANVQVGNGMGRYFTLNAYTDATVTSEGTLKLHDLYGGSIGYQHWWNHALQSNVVYVLTAFDLPDALKQSGVDERVDSWQMNLIYAPLAKGRVGVEYARAHRKVASGDEGTLQQLRLQFRYDF